MAPNSFGFLKKPPSISSETRATGPDLAALFRNDDFVAYFGEADPLPNRAIKAATSAGLPSTVTFVPLSNEMCAFAIFNYSICFFEEYVNTKPPSMGNLMAL